MIVDAQRGGMHMNEIWDGLRIGPGVVELFHDFFHGVDRGSAH